MELAFFEKIPADETLTKKAYEECQFNSIHQRFCKGLIGFRRVLMCSKSEATAAAVVRMHSWTEVELGGLMVKREHDMHSDSLMRCA